MQFYKNDHVSIKRSSGIYQVAIIEYINGSLITVSFNENGTRKGVILDQSMVKLVQSRRNQIHNRLLFGTISILMITVLLHNY
jgi:hypothetical protein